MTGNEDAEDVVQETLLNAYRNPRNFAERSRFPTRLHTTRPLEGLLG